MKKYIVAIEEVVVDEFEVIANDAEEAMEIAIKQYKKGVFVLEPGEVQFKQLAILHPKTERTEWVEF